MKVFGFSAPHSSDTYFFLSQFLPFAPQLTERREEVHVITSEGWKPLFWGTPSAYMPIYIKIQECTKNANSVISIIIFHC